MFLSSEHFILFYSGGFSKVSYLVSYICGSCVLLLLFSNGKSIWGCAKGDVAMSTVLKVISLTGVCSSLAAAVPCFIGVDVAGGSKSNSILVLAKAMLTLSIISPSCFLPP